MKKRPFILLELLIAISLVSLAASPLLSRPLLYLRKELKSLQEIELQWLSSRAILETKALLCQNEIPWSVLSEETPQQIGVPQVFSLLTGNKVRQIISIKTVPKKSDHDTMKDIRLVEITASYSSVKQRGDKESAFSAQVLVKRVSSLPADSS